MSYHIYEVAHYSQQADVAYSLKRNKRYKIILKSLLLEYCLYRCGILDEAQYIKSSSMTTKMASRIVGDIYSVYQPLIILVINMVYMIYMMLLPLFLNCLNNANSFNHLIIKKVWIRSIY